MPNSVRRRAVLAWSVFGAAGALLACSPPSAQDAVSLEQARDDVATGKAVLVDIREPGEHAATGLAPGAKPLPMTQLGQRLSELPADGATPVYLICNTQNRSSSTLKALRERGGYAHVRFVQGGMSEWVRRGWPTVRLGS